MARWQPARADVLADFAREILQVHPRGRLVVGLDGIEYPAAGTAPSDREAFGADLAAQLAVERVPTRAVSMAPFVVAPLPSAPERCIDEAAFRNDVLDPYRRGGLRGLEGDRAVLVVSGPFLHLGDLAGVWHASAWLQLPRAVALERDAARLPGVDLAPWEALVDTAFRRYDARKLANATFDLTDPAYPRRQFEDAC